MIAHVRFAQFDFQGTRLLVGAEQDGAILPGNPVRQPFEFDLSDQFPRLVLVVIVRLELDFGPVTLVGPQGFPAPPRIILDDGIGGVEDGGRAAIILLQLDDFDLRKMLFQIEQVGDFRPAPAINALVIITHHAKVPVLPRQRVDQLKLRGIGVLIFVHHDVLIFGAAGLKRIRMFAKQPQRQQDQIIKIHRIAGVQRRFVAFAHMFREGAHALVAE